MNDLTFKLWNLHKVDKNFEGQKNKTIVATFLASKKMGSHPHCYYNLPYGSFMQKKDQHK
jgi:hypothetical protein